MYLVIGIILTIIFILIDFFSQKERKINLSSKLIIRGIIIIGIIICSFFYNIEETNIKVFSSVILIINLLVSLLTKNNLNKTVKFIFKVVLITLILELTLFNYKHYLTINIPDNSITNIKLINLKKQNNTYIPTNKERIGFKIKLDNNNINSLYFPITNSNSKLVEYKISVLDKESNEYVPYNITKTYDGITNSNYKIINHTINSHTILVEIDKDINGTYNLDNIKINPNIPINFSILRVLIIICFSSVFYVFNPSSFIYKLKFNDKLSKIIIGLFIFVLTFITIVLTNLNPVFRGNNSYKYLSPLVSVNEYQKLTESLLDGKFYLKESPSKKLSAMNNPYNPKERENIFQDSDSYYLWDVAYYNNNYYVYFGITPVITTYIPYYLLTGNHIDNNIVNSIAIVITIISFVFLIKFIMERYFNNKNTGLLILLSSFGLLSSHFMILYASRRPDFYTIPIIYGIMFSLIGLNLWLRSQQKDGTLNKKLLLLGSICMALVSGCRPQLLLISFSSIIIFWDSFKNKKIFSKNSIKETICFILPYIIIAIFMMYYNYVRFGSILDFGANYNLTTNDMTSRGIYFERFLSAIYYYLFACPRITNVFPFIEIIPLNTSYIGITIYELTFGGTFMLCPILFISLFFYKFKKVFKYKKLYYLTALFTLSALIIALVDSQMAGILPRYFLDFNWLLILSTTIIILGLISKLKEKEYIKIFISIFSKITIFLIIFNLLICFIDVSYSYEAILPTLFYKFYYLIQFWI